VSRREFRQRIHDILAAIAQIQRFTRGMSFDAFRIDERTIRAVEMNFIIIGESANQVPEELQEEYPEIPWNLMRAMRNRIVHVYFEIDEQLMWDTIQNDLPPLVGLLEKLI
jgi:uncharacterized protein with HEPN domain